MKSIDTHARAFLTLNILSIETVFRVYLVTILKDFKYIVVERQTIIPHLSDIYESSSEHRVETMVGRALCLVKRIGSSKSSDGKQ